MHKKNIYTIMKSFLTLLLITFGFTVFSQTKGKIEIKTTPEIKNLVSKRIAHNKAKNKIDGYRIQIYYGSENGAISTRNKFMSLFPNSATYIDYESPDWKVKVGNYKTKLEADKAREEILLVFDGAFVLKEQIPLK